MGKGHVRSEHSREVRAPVANRGDAETPSPVGPGWAQRQQTANSLEHLARKLREAGTWQEAMDVLDRACLAAMEGRARLTAYIPVRNGGALAERSE